MIVLLTVASLQQGTIVKDDLLDHLTGKWTITRQFKKRKVTGSAKGEWVLQHHYLRISMTGKPKKTAYDADVYITLEKPTQKYEIYWLDIYAGALPGSIGYGERKGDSIEFIWKDKDGTMRNTFTWYPKQKVWTSTIDQTDKDGQWSNFCVDTYRKQSH